MRSLISWFSSTLCTTITSAFFAVISSLLHASPDEDAHFLALHSFDADTTQMLDNVLRSAFVSVYAAPFARLGIGVADPVRFAELIPEEDIAPYFDRLVEKKIGLYLNSLDPEQLSILATTIRENDGLSVQDILSDAANQSLEDASEQARTNAQRSNSEDQLILALEGMALELGALNTFFEQEGETIDQAMAIIMSTLLAINDFQGEIRHLERPLDNPTSITVLSTPGILDFANPVQRQTLLRQLSDTETRAGINFIHTPGHE